ncbi:MAG TPA: fibronectin type III domain-containing protein [Actinomycetota bacterium]
MSRSGKQLTLDGHSYRPIGLNIYNANSNGLCGPQMDGTTLDDSLTAIGAGKNTMRAWFFQQLATTNGARDWTAFDRTLAAARAHGDTVVATLVDQWGDCGAPSGYGYKDRSWYETGYTQPDPAGIVSYRDWVQEIVSRYKDDPTIMAWQLVNEPEVLPQLGADCSTVPESTAESVLSSFADDVSGLVKSIDPNHLVSLGTIGSGQCGTQGDDYQTVMSIPTLDLCEYHDYTPGALIPGDQFNGLQRRIDQCDTIDKPLLVGELGIRPTDVGGTPQARANVVSGKLCAQLTAGVAGDLLWSWNKDGSLLDNFDIGPGDPVLAELTPWSDPDHVCAPPGSPGQPAATAGNASATVNWNAPPSDGGSAVLSYTVTSSPGGISKTVDARTFAPGAPAGTTINGLTNGTTYTFTVVATNGAGDGPASAPSNAVVPHVINKPGAPRSVAATPGNGNATVTWLPPNSDGGSPVTSYTVTSDAGGFTVTVDGSQTSAVVNGLTNGTTYRFRVTATNVAGTGSASGLSNAVIPRTVPDAPINVTAAPGNGSATVSWTPPTSTGGSAITGYNVTGSPGGATKHVGANATSTNMTGLTNGTTYTFTVVATNAAGSSAPSAPSNPVTPRTVPGAPTGATAVVGNASATISWTTPVSNGGSPILSYTVTSNVGGFSTTVTGTAATITGLANGTTYRFRVVATNAAGNGPASALSNAVTPHSPPGAPTSVVATGGNRMATVTWAAAPANGGAITGYRIIASPGGATTTVGGSTLNAVVTGLNNGTTYTFSVIATNDLGDGPAGVSNAVTPTSTITPIVFASNRSGSSGSDIYLMNSDGSGVVRVLKHAGDDTDPALSPDGTRIVFVAGANQTSEIMVVNIDGTGLQQLTTNTTLGYTDQNPNWSPDGTKIVFASNQDGGGDLEIYVMNADGSAPTPLTDNTSNDYQPAWSSGAAQRIAFSSNRLTDAEIWVMDTDGQHQARVATIAGADVTPAWSPDGTKIAFSSSPPQHNTDIYVMDADGAGLVDVTPNTNGTDTAPAWSPDGARIAFSSNRSGSSGYDVYTTNADGTGTATNLTTRAGTDGAPDW